MAKRRRKKRKLLYRVLGWIGISMVLAGIGLIVLCCVGVMPLVSILIGGVLLVVGVMIWVGAATADHGDDDPKNPMAVSAMGARG
jgi:predicted membrane channel-forming protein YqfA (hemolysin III family)